MTTARNPARHAYRCRVGTAIMTVNGVRRSCLIFGDVEAVDPTTAAYSHNATDHAKMDQHVKTAMETLRSEGNSHVLSDTAWAQDRRHVIQVATCCLSALDLERLSELVITAFNDDDGLGIRLMPCSCEENCTCTPAVCEGWSA